MRQSIILFAIFLLAGSAGLKAQSLQNSAWKLYVDQLQDTITLHIMSDSSFVTQGRGEGSVVVRSVFTISKDTVTMKDYDGQYACLGDAGVYTYKIKDNTLVFSLVGDGCEGRKGSINGVTWIRK